ncbi:rho GTPase-activating protein 18 [Asbolus verrucosus]|uniref:Rho GTPase-activating protein 18 n=1 Tax=Asbolus verrucosus TaxID=1661398 RepID=A0A482VPQ7_ASBVE|nr:rho GTPase-activating protein 18 [Asbolus verrucosus]
MESEEALNYYINEVTDTNNEIEIEEEQVPNEAEQAADFLQKVGLSDLTKLYNQGKEITENIVNDSTSSTGTRSRSATPDSLDSVGILNDDLTSDEDQQLSSLPPFKVYINGDENEILSFEGLMKQNKISQLSAQNLEICDEGGIDIDEFTDSEYQYLKPLLYVELVAIFDQHKIVFLKRKASTKYKGKLRKFAINSVFAGGNVFGVNLSTLVMRDMQRPTDNFMVPKIFQSVINQLNTRYICEDGILRLAGQKQKLEYLCNEIESKFFTNRQEVENMLEQATVHELTGVLKKLLRDLPDPVFTMELFDMFYKTSMIPNNEDKLKALNLLVLLLPIEHRNTYKLLLQFLLNVVKHEKQNRMNLHNVAMITAPSFFPARLLLPKDNNSKLIVKQLSQEELAKHINGAAVCCVIMETMLRAGLNLWIIPRYLAHQAKEAQKRAQDKKDSSRDRDKRIPCGKTKLVRSSTQYEPGPINSPRIKKEFYI